MRGDAGLRDRSETPIASDTSVRIREAMKGTHASLFGGDPGGYLLAPVLLAL